MLLVEQPPCFVFYTGVGRLVVGQPAPSGKSSSTSVVHSDLHTQQLLSAFAQMFASAFWTLMTIVWHLGVSRHGPSHHFLPSKLYCHLKEMSWRISTATPGLFAHFLNYKGKF